MADVLDHLYYASHSNSVGQVDVDQMADHLDYPYYTSHSNSVGQYRVSAGVRCLPRKSIGCIGFCLGASMEVAAADLVGLCWCKLSAEKLSAKEEYWLRRLLPGCVHGGSCGRLDGSLLV